MIFLIIDIVLVENSSKIFKTSIKNKIYEEIHRRIDPKEKKPCKMGDASKPMLHQTLKNQKYQF